MTNYVRAEWLDTPRHLTGTVDDTTPTLADFAFDDTAAVLEVEPRLLALALLVQRAAPDDDLWLGVEQLVALLLGPTRSASQVTPITSTSVAVRGALTGATTRQRFIDALRNLTTQDAA
jgi:hypothetical protein